MRTINPKALQSTTAVGKQRTTQLPSYLHQQLLMLFYFLNQQPFLYSVLSDVCPENRESEGTQGQGSQKSMNNSPGRNGKTKQNINLVQQKPNCNPIYKCAAECFGSRDILLFNVILTHYFPKLIFSTSFFPLLHAYIHLYRKIFQIGDVIWSIIFELVSHNSGSWIHFMNQNHLV